MARFRLRCFGGFALFHEDGRELAVPGRKAQALLAYLALNADRPHTREKLATLLWGDRYEDQARHSLRQAVLTLRKALDDGDAAVLASERDGLRIDSQAFSVDALEFERLAAGDGIESLLRAAALHDGELLDGLNVRSEGFDGWVPGERTRLRNAAAAVLGRIVAYQAEAGEAEAAIGTAQRLLALDPLREEAHRALMRLYAETGQRSAALRQYRLLEESLRRELDAEPEGESVRLHEQLRTHQTAAGAPSEAVEAEGNGAADEAQRSEAAGPPSRDAPADAEAPAAPARPFLRRPSIWAAVAGAILLLVGGLSLDNYLAEMEAGIENAREADLAFPLPEKLSIAVLPFQNLSGDPAQDSFIDGITEGITTALSIVSDMFVIARNSALVYKGNPVKVQQVAEELGVRYVLEGSVQRVGGKVRISAQLIDAIEGHHLWADRYDREVEDIFALQDEITLEIITALQVQMTEGEQERVSLVHGTSNLEAWVVAGQGRLLLRHLTREDNVKARELYRQATELDPDYPGAWDGLAWTHLIDARFGWSVSREASVLRAAELVQKTLTLDPGRPRTYALLGTIRLVSGDHAEAVTLGEKAVALSPNGADVAALLAYTLTYNGEEERAIAMIEKAMRLSPSYPLWYRWVLGRAYRLAGRYREAIAALKVRLPDSPDSLSFRVELVACYAESGQTAKARIEAAEVIRLEPGFSARAWTQAPPHADAAATEREFELLRRAGLPA